MASLASQEELVQEEMLAMKGSKIAVFLLVILAGIGGTVVKSCLVKQAEQDKLNQEVCGNLLRIMNLVSAINIKESAPRIFQ
jgi:hypothetical protein